MAEKIPSESSDIPQPTNSPTENPAAQAEAAPQAQPQPESTSQPSQAAATTSQASPGASQPSKPKEPAASKPPSKGKRFVRRLWRWTLTVLVVFGLGFVAATWLLYVPARRSALQAQAQAQQAARQVTDLQSQIKQLKSAQSDLQQKLQAAQQDTQREHLQTALAEGLMEAYATRVALKDEDATGARLHADALIKAMDEIQQFTPADHQDLVKQMQQQAADIQAKIDSSNYADRQLRALIQHLMALEQIVLGK